MRGKFITLEGGEGAGKSTQAALLVEQLAEQGIKAIATREVGGTLGAEQIRQLWLHHNETQWDVLTEVLLIMAARREHLVKKIWPALETGTWVISDRYVDSTRVYQGLVLGLGLVKVDTLYEHIAGSFWPDITLLLDLPVTVSQARMQARRAIDDRFERQNSEFHQQLQAGFLTLYAAEPQRITLIPAGGTATETAQLVRGAVQRILPAHA
jgi:dTMP kinase